MSQIWGIVQVYIQSAYKLPTPEKKEQEVRGLKKIGDAFCKLVIVDGVQPLYTDEFGISYVGLIDFKLNRDSPIGELIRIQNFRESSCRRSAAQYIFSCVRFLFQSGIYL